MSKEETQNINYVKNKRRIDREQGGRLFAHGDRNREGGKGKGIRNDQDAIDTDICFPRMNVIVV